jgi:hypothetical protein
MTKVCCDWCSPILSLYNVYILGSYSTVFTEVSSMVWKNMFGGSTIFLAATLASSSAFVYFVLSMYLTVNPLK